MPSLVGAHRGYHHQDIVTALALANLLVARAAPRAVRVDIKRFDDDVFDDLALEGLRSTRVQIKSHTTDERELTLADLATTAINFPLDRAVQSILADPEPSDEYRLLVTYDRPADDLQEFLEPADDVDAILPGIPTSRFRLSLDRVWPLGGEGWQRIRGLDRSDVSRFLQRFVVETGCPLSSRDLRNPGPLDEALMTLLVDRVGVARPPNEHIEPASAAAHLIGLAQRLRSEEFDGLATDVTAAIGLKTDYARVEEVLPLDPSHLVSRSTEIAAITAQVEAGGRLVISGPPGAGKSWLLHLVRDALVSDGWIVALHFCFIDLLDQARALRTTVTTIFGSLIAELLDAAPDLASDDAPRYAAGPTELEALLRAAVDESPDLRIAVIVDGLDHVDRESSSSGAEIAEELASLDLPDRVALIVGSQPGDHLGPLTGALPQHEVAEWDHVELGALVDQLGVLHAVEALEIDRRPVIEVIADRSRGNPLYATYLSRAVAEALATPTARSFGATDVVEFVEEAPSFAGDLDDYYSWLLKTLESDEGALHVARLMATLDFAVTVDDLIAIYPASGPLIARVIARLGPVLCNEPALGGLRIYHESFQRYLRQNALDAGTDIAAVVAPAIGWLDTQGLAHDKRAFRSLLVLMEAAGRHAEVLERVDTEFVANAVAEGQPGDAVMLNLRLAASSAVQLGSWPGLARLIEIARSADHLYHWRLNDESLAEEYGRAFAAMRGAPVLADRLLHDGRCTFLPRPGLVLCELCEEMGIPAPWSQYLTAHDQLLETDNTQYGSGDQAIYRARVLGELRTAGHDGAINRARGWLAEPTQAPVHSLDVARRLADLYGDEALDQLVAQLHDTSARSWALLARAERQDDDADAASTATDALEAGLPATGFRLAMKHGATIPEAVLAQAPDLLELTGAVTATGFHISDGQFETWLAAVELAAAQDDDAILATAELVVPANSWFHRWLRFALLIHRRDMEAPAVLAALDELSHDIRILEGGPRVVDLLRIHDDIQASFRLALERLDDDDLWDAAAESLARLSRDSTAWLGGSRTGPLPVDDLLETLMATATTERRARTTVEYAKAELSPATRPGEYYDTHAADQMLLARLLAGAGDRHGAELAWAEAAQYLASYGFRKDITVFETIDNLDALAQACPDEIATALEQLHPIVERVLVHTDGKETRWAIHKWVDAAGLHDPVSTLAFLGRRGLEHAPSFGDLDHGMASALAALSPVVDEDAAIAGWIGIGSEAREEFEPAILAAEPEPTPAWDIIIGSLVGDGPSAPSGSGDLIARSATQLGKPPITTSEPEPEPAPTARTRSEEDAHRPEFAIPPDAFPGEVARAVRRWRDSTPGASTERVVGEVAAHLLRLLGDDRVPEAEALLGRLARDTPPWDRRGLLDGLADTLLVAGPPRLAAIAATYSLTRTTDGWRRFGGEHQEHFRRALESDHDAAMATLMAEVADAVRTGGDMGVNRRLVELLALADHPDQAWQTWSEVRRVIESRLPTVGDADTIETTYVATSLSPDAALCCALLARLNHVKVHERRVAIVALGRLIRRPGDACAAAISIAATHAPASVLTTLLALVEEHELAPYATTHSALDALRTIASGPLVVARDLARSLLERVDVDRPTAPSTTIAATTSVTEERLRHLVDSVGIARLDPVQAEWDDFRTIVSERLDIALRSEELKSRGEMFHRRMVGGRVGRRADLWAPINEEVEEILQTVGASARANRAVTGSIDPSVEERVARALLPDTALGERLAASRTPRPTHLSPLSEQKPTTGDPTQAVSEPAFVPNGEYRDWFIIGHHEAELIVGEDMFEPVSGTAETWSSLLFTDEPPDLRGDLPVSRGLPALWTTESNIAPDRFGGPLAGFQIVRDAFGVVSLLTPHQILVSAARLRPAPSGFGLAMVDAAGSVAVRLRIWRERTMGGDYLDDWEHRTMGMELIARPDVVEQAAGFASTQKLVMVSALMTIPRST